jgi:hypothetical protein
MRSVFPRSGRRDLLDGWGQGHSHRLEDLATRPLGLAPQQEPLPVLLHLHHLQSGPLSRRLRRLRHLRRRSDSYRLERPVIRAGIAPAEDPSLSTAHCYSDPVLRGCPRGFARMDGSGSREGRLTGAGAAMAGRGRSSLAKRGVSGKLGFGGAWCGWQGVARRGKAGRGPAGLAWRCKVWRGRNWLGTVWQA